MFFKNSLKKSFHLNPSMAFSSFYTCTREIRVDAPSLPYISSSIIKTSSSSLSPILSFVDLKTSSNSSTMITRFIPYDSLPQVQLQTNESESIEKILPPIVNDKDIFDTFPSSIKDSKIELVPKMLNLLGCNRENFLKLLKKMNYNVSLENDKYFFKYNPIRKVNKKNRDIVESDNPFAALKQLNIK